MKGIAKFALWLLVTLLALPIVVYAVLIAVNWDDSAKSARVQQLETLIAQHQLEVSDMNSDNGFISALGVSANVTQDPFEVGLARVNASDDSFTFYDDLAQLKLKWAFKACFHEDDFLTECETAISQDPSLRTTVKAHQWLLPRYQALLAKSQWHDLLPAGDTANLGYLARLSDAQIHYLLSHYFEANTYTPAELQQSLAADMQFWQRVAENTQNLITKMVATNAIEANLQFGELTLNLLPRERLTQSLPDNWQHPFSAPLLSMDNVLRGEWYFFVDALSLDPLVNDDASWFEKAAMLFLAPLLKTQDTLNRYAMHLQQVSHDVNCEPEGILDAVEAFAYNPLGKLFLCASSPSIAVYQERVVNLESIRLATLARLLDDKLAAVNEPNAH